MSASVERVVHHLQKLCRGQYIPINSVNQYLQSHVVQNTHLENLTRYNVANYQRIILASNHNTSIHLLGLLPGQNIPLQKYYNFNVFFTVLEGQLVEYIHFHPHLTTKHFIHKVGSGNFLNDFIGHHQFNNRTNKKACMLQFFVC